MAPPAAVAAFMGTWHVAHSTLGMWKSGGRSNPRLVYTDLSEQDGAGAANWTDTVLFDQPGLFSSKPSPQTIVGKDKVTGQEPLSFRWTGAGWLRFVHSDCKVLAHDPGFEEYAVVHFAATPFTEEGVDVLARSAGGLPQQRLEEALAALEPAVQELVRAKGLARTQTTGV